MLSKTCWKQKLGTDYNKYKSNRDANTLLKKLCYHFNEVNTFFVNTASNVFFFKTEIKKNQLAEYLEERAWMKINIEIDYTCMCLYFVL